MDKRRSSWPASVRLQQFFVRTDRTSRTWKGQRDRGPCGQFAAAGIALVYRRRNLPARSAGHTDATHIEHWGTFVTTPAVYAAQAIVKVANTVVNQSDRAAAGRDRRSRCLTPNGNVIRRETGSISTIAPGQTHKFESEIAVDNPERWSWKIRSCTGRWRQILVDGAKPVDDETVTFGIREFHFVPETGFWLNGKNFKIKEALVSIMTAARSGRLFRWRSGNEG